VGATTAVRGGAAGDEGGDDTDTLEQRTTHVPIELVAP
jgi:hypothetical protein